jgi:hypothetical protein
MKFNEARDYAQGLNTQKAHGHDDWHVPTKAELDVVFNNRAVIGGFNVTSSDPAGWYWFLLAELLMDCVGPPLQRRVSGPQL